jgi:small-conductance mechanosensitive channel
MSQFSTLIQDLGAQSAPLEGLVLLICLLLALGLTKLISRSTVFDTSENSVWFGQRFFDGLMFPLLSLVFTYASSVVWSQTQHAALFKIAVPVLLSVVAIRFMVRVLSTVFPGSSAILMIERAVSYLIWLIAILWITGVLPWVNRELESIYINFGRTKLDLRTFFEGLLSCGLVLVLTLWISATIESRVLAHAVEDLSIRKVATNILRVSLTFLGLLIALSAVGVDLTALSVLGGGLGVGLGLGLQKLASNYVSGFVILLERSLRIGDQVRLNGLEGRITDIKNRFTLIRDAAGRENVVPNELMVSERVENLSKAFGRVLLQVNLSVDYASDLVLTQNLLSSACAQVERVLKSPAPETLLVNLGVEGLELAVVFWVDSQETAWLKVKSLVNAALLQALKENNIKIPTSQRVVRLIKDGALTQD